MVNWCFFPSLLFSWTNLMSLLLIFRMMQDELCSEGTNHSFDIWHIGKNMYCIFMLVVLFRLVVSFLCLFQNRSMESFAWCSKGEGVWGSGGQPLLTTCTGRQLPLLMEIHVWWRPSGSAWWTMSWTSKNTALLHLSLLCTSTSVGRNNNNEAETGTTYCVCGWTLLAVQSSVWCLVYSGSISLQQWNTLVVNVIFVI